MICRWCYKTYSSITSVFLKPNSLFWSNIYYMLSIVCNEDYYVNELSRTFFLLCFRFGPAVVCVSWPTGRGSSSGVATSSCRTAFRSTTGSGPFTAAQHWSSRHTWVAERLQEYNRVKALRGSAVHILSQHVTCRVSSVAQQGQGPSRQPSTGPLAAREFHCVFRSTIGSGPYAAALCRSSRNTWV